MVTVIKRRKGNQNYYYLKHSLRKNNRQKEIYLGKKIPQNIEEIKRDFMIKFYEIEWLPKLEKIRMGYAKEIKSIPKSVMEKQLRQFSVKFTYHTQRIEGSALTLNETHDLLEEGKTPRLRPINDVKEAEIHQKLFLELVQDKKLKLTLELVCRWHKRLFEQTDPEIAGKIRTYKVGIGSSRFIPPPPVAVPSLLRGFFAWYKKNEKILNQVELAALVHLKFVTIHPFGNGNGRISRLLMNYVLNISGHPMTIIDYADRRTYYNALERSQLNRNDIVFLAWFMKRYLKAFSRFLN